MPTPHSSKVVEWLPQILTPVIFECTCLLIYYISCFRL